MPTAAEQKERILYLIRSNGPTLPVRVASETKIEPLFASAFLSELYGERLVRISNLRVGGSPLYYLEGQESQLENFTQHLNQREKEAFLRIKEKRVLDDEKESPVMRVALRAIKDFAIPLKDPSQPQKIMWRYHQVPEHEALQIITQPRIEKKEEKHVEKEAVKTEKTEQQFSQNTQPETLNEQKKDKPKRERIQKKQAAPQEFSLSIHQAQQTTPFADEVKAFIEREGYGIQSLVSADKKECVIKASLQGPHGIQTYLVVSKDKKKIKQEELVESLEEAHKQRLLCMVISRGELDKKSEAFVSSWKNFLIHKTLK